MPRAQDWLEQNCSKDITMIFGSDRGLTGEMDLKNFPKVTKLSVFSNQITKLNNLPVTLTELSVQSNPIKQDVKDFAHLVNLADLSLNHTQVYGNLRSFYGMNKLERLCLNGDSQYSSTVTGNYWLLPPSVNFCLSSSGSSITWTSIVERRIIQPIQPFSLNKHATSIQEVKSHWNTNSTNGKVNDKTIDQVLGSNWEKEFEILLTDSSFDNKKNEFKQKIDAAKREQVERERREKEAREQREKEAREQREKEERIRQTQQKKTNTIQTIESHWKTNQNTNQQINDKTIVQALGSNWKEKINNLNTETEINNEQNRLIGEINKFKLEEQKQQSQAIIAIENHWNQTKDNNGKVNNQTIEQALGSNWKDNFNSLTTAEQIKNEQDKLTSTINKAKEEESKEVCSITEHKILKEELNQLKSAKLTDYTPLTQKETGRGKNESGEYTSINFHENFQTKDGERNYLAVFDFASQELKDWAIKHSKVWALTKYLTEEWHARIVSKEDLVNPNSSLFMHLNTLQELAKTQEQNQTFQTQIAQLNDLLDGQPFEKTESQMEAKIVQTTINLPPK